MCLLQQCGSLSSQISLCLGCGVLCVLQFSKYTGLLCMIAMGKLSRQCLGPLPGTGTRCCIVPGRCTAGIFFSNVRACYVLILFHYSAARGESQAHHAVHEPMFSTCFEPHPLLFYGQIFSEAVACVVRNATCESVNVGIYSGGLPTSVNCYVWSKGSTEVICLLAVT